jgi:hypothetical protein
MKKMIVARKISRFKNFARSWNGGETHDFFKLRNSTNQSKVTKLLASDWLFENSR